MATLEQVVDAIIAEAIGEGEDGMAAVAWSMQNRANESGKAITDVVTKGAYSGLGAPGSAAARAQRDPATRERVKSILEAVTTGAYPDPTGGATHYWAPKGMPGGKDPYWADEEASRYGRHRIGNHVFLPKREPGRIPPGEVNFGVGTLTDTVPSRKVTPVTPSPSIAAYRAATQAPTSLISIPTASGLGQMMEKGMLTKPVSSTRLTPKSAITAGSTRIAADTRTFRDANQASRTVGTASKSAVTPQSTRIATDTRLMRNANQAKAAPSPVQQSSQLLGARTAASVPAAQAAANRMAAASRPVARLPALPPSTLDQRLASTPLPRPRPNTTAVVATFPTAARPASAFGSFPQGGRVAAPSQPLTIERAKKLYADMGTQYMSPGPKLTVGQMYAGTPIGAGVQLANVGNRLSPNPSVQSAALAARRGQTAPVQTAAARRVAPVPFDRPYFPEGIGGPDLVGLPQKGAPNTSVKNGVKTFSTGKGPLQPNLAQRIGSNFMNNTVAGRAIGGVQVGFDNLAAGRPLLGTPAQQGAALRGIGNALMNNTLGGRLIGMFTGQQPNPLQSVVSFLEPQRANPVGTILGQAANGGQMTQGVNGIMNSITQNSAAWKEATGQQDRYTSNGDGSFTSAGGGVYYDRHIN